MDQLTHLSNQQIEKINPNDVLGALKGIVPRSFEKTFNGLTTKQIEYAFSLCIQGLTRDQITVGMNTTVEQGFCPDPAMFRKWCLGIKGFTADVDPILASYRKKNASLANIEAWLIDDTTPITNAEREAYNRSYAMFNNLKWNYSDNQRFHTYEAFKDFYTEVVNELVKNGIAQCDWTPPPAIADTKDDVKNKAEPKVQSDDEKNISQRLQTLVASGMSIGDASRLVMKEKYKK